MINIWTETVKQQPPTSDIPLIDGEGWGRDAGDRREGYLINYLPDPVFN